MQIRRIFSLCCFLLLAIAATSQTQSAGNSIIGSWTGKLKVGVTQLTIVLHFEQADGSLKCTIDSPDQNAKGISVHNDYISADSIALSINSLGAAYRARIDGDKLIGSFSQMGYSFPLTMTKGAYTLRRPQTPQAPFPYLTEEVTFFNAADNSTLAGTLTYPIGYKATDKVPVVIMVSGSGLQNRDEEIFSHKPFLVIADYLARNGIASLRYDDRAYGASTGGDRVGSKALTPDYMRDAQAGTDYLRRLNKFSLIGVLGHSEGANIAFMLGSRQCTDFVISMAGVGVRVDEALTEQYNAILQSQGQPMKIDTAQYRKIAQAANSEWMNWFIDYDPAADITATACPVLAINGDKDCQVISSQNLPAIKKQLQQNPQNLVKEYPSLNHLFQHCQTGLPAEYNDIEETIAPEVLSDIVKWINSLK